MANQIEAGLKIRQLGKLPNGWDFGTGGPATAVSMVRASVLLQTLSKLGSTDFDVVPGDAGGIVLVAYHGDKSAEIHCLSNGKYDLLHEDANGIEVSFDGISTAKLIVSLEGFGWQSPRFYASCTRNAMFQESDGSLAWLSETPVMVVGCQLFVPTAFKPKVLGRVSTFGNITTPESAESHRSSGAFQSLRFREALA